MTDGFSIRDAQPRDADALAAFAAQVDGAPRWPAYVYASLSTDPTKLVLITESEAGLAGYLVAALIPPAPEVELEAIVVDPAFHRQGHGRALLVAMLHWAAAKGANRVLLEVRASNVVAQRFYRAHDFVLCGRRPHYYQNPEEDAVLMDRISSSPARGESPVPVR